MNNILRFLEEVVEKEKGDSESTMNKLKIGSIFILLVLCFVFAMLPHLFEKFQNSTTFSSYINCFSGGLFFGIAFFELLPEANDNMQEGNEELYKVGLTYYIIFFAYIGMICIEKIIFADVELEDDKNKEPAPQTQVPNNKNKLPQEQMIIYQPQTTGERINTNEQNSPENKPENSPQNSPENRPENGPENQMQENQQQENIPENNQQENQQENMQENSPENIPENNQEEIQHHQEEQTNTQLNQINQNNQNNQYNQMNEDFGISQAQTQPNTPYVSEAKPASEGFRPYIFLISLSFDSFFEGVTLGIMNDKHELLFLLAALVAHKWAESITLGIRFVKANFSRIRHIIFAIIYSLISPIGIILGLILSSFDNNPMIVGVFLSISTGIFIYFTCSEVVGEEFGEEETNIKPGESKKPNKKVKKLFLYILGAALCAAVSLFEYFVEDKDDDD